MSGTARAADDKRADEQYQGQPGEADRVPDIRHTSGQGQPGASAQTQGQRGSTEAAQIRVIGVAVTSLMNSWRVASSSRNTPRTALVTRRASWAPMPRAAMHMCRPST